MGKNPENGGMPLNDRRRIINMIMDMGVISVVCVMLLIENFEFIQNNIISGIEIRT